MTRQPASRNRARLSSAVTPAWPAPPGPGQQSSTASPEAFADGRFGAAGYADTSELPEGAVRASLGCGNPVAVADLHPGETVLDLGSGGGIDVLLSARRVAPGGTAYGLDGSARTCSPSPAPTPPQAGVTNAAVPARPHRGHPAARRHVDVVISNCVINLSADKPRVLAEAFRVLRPGRPPGRQRRHRRRRHRPRPARRRRTAGRLLNGALTRREYAGVLRTAGFTEITITLTHEAGRGCTPRPSGRPNQLAEHCSMASGCPLWADARGTDWQRVVR